MPKFSLYIYFQKAQATLFIIQRELNETIKKEPCFGDCGKEKFWKLNLEWNFENRYTTRILAFLETLFDCIFQNFTIMAILW